MHPRTKTVSATVIKTRFGDYLGEVIHRKEPIVVERHGKPVAVLVNFKEWEGTGGPGAPTREHPWIVAAKRLSDEIDRTHPNMKPFSAAALIRQIRDEGV